jgi:hypothetical protein
MQAERSQEIMTCKPGYQRPVGAYRVVFAAAKWTRRASGNNSLKPTDRYETRLWMSHRGMGDP